MNFQVGQIWEWVDPFGGHLGGVYYLMEIHNMEEHFGQESAVYMAIDLVHGVKTIFPHNHMQYTGRQIA